MDTEDTLLATASMYYLQEMTMESIAARSHTSRSTVSRRLKEARARGLVEISLRPTPSRAPGIAQRISDAFGVEAFVVPITDSSTDVDRLEHVASAAAGMITGWFDSGMVLGVAWGTTLAAVARHLGRKSTRGSAIVQLNGAANTRSSGVEYAGSLIARFGAAFDAQVQLFPVPAFFDFAETRRAMWRERSVMRVLDVQRRVDVALFSVGAVAGDVPSHVYSTGYLDGDDIALLEREGVVGDVCTVFLRADGSYLDLAINDRATGPTPGELQRIRRRVCVVAGDNKAVPLLAALRAGAMTHLVLDELTALRLEQIMD